MKSKVPLELLPFLSKVELKIFEILLRQIFETESCKENDEIFLQFYTAIKFLMLKMAKVKRRPSNTFHSITVRTKGKNFQSNHEYALLELRIKLHKYCGN